MPSRTWFDKKNLIFHKFPSPLNKIIQKKGRKKEATTGKLTQAQYNIYQITLLHQHLYLSRSIK
jgi:hypothetical protein